MNVLNHSFRITAVAAAFAAQAASAATPVVPTTILYGGGATFPAEAYVGPAFLGTTPTAVARRLSRTVGVPGPVLPDDTAAAISDKGSLFGALAGLNIGTIGVSYCQTGSGTGKRVLNGVSGFTGTGKCGDFLFTPVGFSNPAAVVDADFAGTDSPYSQSELTAFNTNRSARVQPVQIPEVAGAIALVYNNPALGKKKLNLTRSDVCGIVSGRITNWDQLTHTPKVIIAAKPLTFVYRSDNSGTSFSFLNFLSHACSNLTLPQDIATASGRFKTTETFSTAAAPLPAGAIGASGNGGIVTTVSTTDGAIGYADVADSIARAKLAGPTKLTFATVSYAADLPKLPLVIPKGGAMTGTCPTGTVGKLPGTSTIVPITTVTNTSTTKDLKFTCPAVVYNKLDPQKNLVVKGATSIAVTSQSGMVLTPVAADGTVSLTPATSALASPSCLQTVNPGNYAQPTPVTAAKPKAALDFDRYPIIAVSYLLAYNAGNGAKAAALKTLLKAGYDTAVLGKTKTIGKTSGFQPLVLTSTAGSAASIIDSCIN